MERPPSRKPAIERRRRRLAGIDRVRLLKDGESTNGPFPIPIEAEIDLHSFAPRDVASVVEEYLLACREQRIFEVRIVHGRGKGVQRAVVHRLLRGLSNIESFRDAPPESGGWGATLVRLTR